MRFESRRLPQPPTSLAATVQGVGAILRWQPNPAGDRVIWYSVYRDDDWIAETTETHFLDEEPGIVSSQIFTYYVTATNASGTSPPSATATVTILGPPAAPTGLQATVNKDGSVTLAWTANAVADSVSGYAIWRAPAGGAAAVQIGTVGGAVTTYTDPAP